jgi:Kef-type K+ transport system membrane component KefB/nucleotide-binding universal stress UspA family protein
VRHTNHASSLTAEHLSPYVYGLAILLLSATGTHAAQSTKIPSDVLFLVQLLILMLAGRLLGEVMNRIGQPSVMGQLLAGILLGPSVLGWVWPDLQHTIFPSARESRLMLDALSQFGILLLLLLTGMETDLRLVRKVGKAAISISVSGVIVPFTCGVMLGWLMPESLLPHPEQRLLTSLFLGTALSISSIKILAAIVREMNFTRRNLGQVIVASAVLEDTIGWIIIAIIFGLAEAGKIDFTTVAKSLFGASLFLIASFTIGRRIVSYLIRWTNDSFQGDFPVITTILVIMVGMALLTHFIGVHTVLGAFVAGVLIGESPILTKYIDAQLRGLILGFFMPVFFGAAGLSADLTILTNPTLLLMTVGLIAIASIGKFAGAFIGGEIGGMKRREALALACGMNARGSTEVIIATIGLSMGALSQNLYSMIVAMALITTMSMPPMLRWALSRVPLGKEEQERLEREEFEAKGFVPNLERLLLAVDDSANGKFTSHIAGLIAGGRDLPTTILQLAKGKPARRTEPISARAIETTVKDAAKAAKSLELEKASPVDVIVRDVSSTPNEEAVSTEGKKGYNLLFLGIANMRSKNGTFNPKIGRIVAAFEGPVAIVTGQGDGLKRRKESGFNILVPVTGTDVSRRAAEVALSLARGCPITALYVANPTRRRRPWRIMREHRHQEAILKEIAELGGRYDIKVETVIRSNIRPEEAIISEATKREQDLIVMGVKRRPGEQLFFGEAAAAVLAKLPTSILFLSS